eukprot:TRINITY_DN64097_c0_g1_i1.p1 TRINITY_DN64097_c0_g1~~TRINITY_DN64097_c0_g1_i1.p1  ORF type:complete len:590 (-),score=120.83 TRINITY_DN64097_c0_g1_i1:21-1619(-)
MVPGAKEHPELQQVLLPTLEGITEQLRLWWLDRHPDRDRNLSLRRIQSFVTRYRPNPGESYLKRHVDGPQVDASLILQLHSPLGFSGGGISVWDPGPFEGRRFFQLHAGDLCFLDHMVWHQSHPISSGERWVLVVFCQLQEPEHQNDSVGDKKSADLILQQLQSDSSTERGQGAVALVTSGSSDQSFIASENIIKALKRMLKAPSTEERERAAFALGCLAANNSENQAVIASLGVINQLLDLLRDARENSAKVRAWAAAALGRLSAGNAQNKDLIAAAGAIELLVTSLHSDCPVEREEAASAIGNLAANSDTNKRLILQAEAVEPLVLLLHSKNAGERIWATAALGNLSSVNAESKALIIKAGALDVLVSLLDDESIKQRERAAAVLGMLASDSPENQVLIAEAGAIKPLVALLESVEASLCRCRLEAAYALEEIALIAENQVQVVEAGAIKPLTSLLQSQSSAEHERAAYMIGVLAQSNAENQHVFSCAEGLVNHLQLLLKSEDSGAREGAEFALRALQHVDQDREDAEIY